LCGRSCRFLFFVLTIKLLSCSMLNCMAGRVSVRKTSSSLVSVGGFAPPMPDGVELLSSWRGLVPFSVHVGAVSGWWLG
jgi:hypothetical protein